MSKLLNSLTIREVDDLIRASSSIKEAAKKMGVDPQKVYLFRSQNSKAFQKLKTDREAGLIIDEVQVVKTKPVEKKTVSQIKAKDSRDDEIKKLKSELEQEKEITETLAAQVKDLNEQVVNIQDENKALTERNKEIEDKSVKMKEMQHKLHAKQLAHQQTKIDGQLTTLKLNVKQIEAMRNRVKQLEKENRELTLEYESLNIEQQSIIQDKTKEVISLNRKLEDITRVSELAKVKQEKASQIEVIDYIDQVIALYNSVTAFNIGNVIMHISKAPGNNGLEDLEIARYYLDRAINQVKLQQQDGV